MRALVILMMIAGCRGGFDELPAERPAPDPHDVVLDNPLAVWYELDDVGAFDTSGNELHGTCRANTCPPVVAGHIVRAALFTSALFVDIPELPPMDAITMTGFVKLSSTTLACIAIDSTFAWAVCALPNTISFRTGTHTLAIGMPIPRNAWIHVAARYDGTEKTLFVDGRRVGTAPALATVPQLFSIGGFNGQLDDVRIFNRALPDDAIAQLGAELN